MGKGELVAWMIWRRYDGAFQRVGIYIVENYLRMKTRQSLKKALQERNVKLLGHL